MFQYRKVSCHLKKIWTNIDTSKWPKFWTKTEPHCFVNHFRVRFVWLVVCFWGHGVFKHGTKWIIVLRNEALANIVYVFLRYSYENGWNKKSNNVQYISYMSCKTHLVQVYYFIDGIIWGKTETLTCSFAHATLVIQRFGLLTFSSQTGYFPTLEVIYIIIY